MDERTLRRRAVSARQAAVHPCSHSPTEDNEDSGSGARSGASLSKLLLVRSVASLSPDASSSRLEELPLPSESTGTSGARTLLNAFEECFELRVLAFVRSPAFARAIASSVVSRERAGSGPQARSRGQAEEQKTEVRATTRAMHFDCREPRIPPRSRSLT